jgi:hypothetical protein
MGTEVLVSGQAVGTEGGITSPLSLKCLSLFFFAVLVIHLLYFLNIEAITMKC